ncbi:RTA1 like protein-domain-containing protein [Lentinula edodes]|uniref:RTA1 like protein-domain-containing protein n=1 Tax=Lentinula edodes TaxID=5353 RepID=UPI001E8EF243|nr:RTA1 like protein-domain-containing protein [Lentinula edodes]KAH7874399.1 RTA1 like protein-domain-containing protein [Lentinula edodes]KAJ3901858.1 RTA1 like protein-domain-containing protein [Lentinula edodes]
MSMFNRISLLSAMLYGVALVVASSESPNLNSRSIHDIETRDTTTERPVAGFVMKVWPAVIGAAMYGVSGLLHWIHFFRVGQRYMLTLTIGMTCMTIGLVLRIAVSHSPYSLALYILEDMLVLLSPCAFLATDYILLSRLANSLGRDIADDCLLIPSRRITKIFVWSDVITFWVQAFGGGMSASAKMATIGTTVSMVGLVLQLVSFGLFTILLVTFGFRVLTKYPKAWDVQSSVLSVAGPFKTSTTTNWKILYFTMCFTCTGILTRSAFRIAEFAGGYNGYLATHEGYFFLLDALPLWIVMTTYCFFWPTRFINQDDANAASRYAPASVPLVESNKYGSQSTGSL